MRVVKMLRSALSYILCVPILCFIVLPCLIVLMIAPTSWYQQRSSVYRMLDYLYRSFLYILLLPRDWRGVEHIPREPAIIVANHQSSIDILVVGALMGGAPHIWYAMAYYARHSFFGLFLGRLGIPVDIEKPGASAKSLLKGVRLLHDDPRHVIIFPEGGRYPDTDVESFYRGFAVIAKQTGRPVVPVYMPNNGAILHPQSYLIDYHTIVAQVGQTFYVQEHETEHEFVDRVREWFVQQSQQV